MKFVILISACFLAGTEAFRRQQQHYPFPSLGQSSSSQLSQVHGGNDITGIANGLSTSQGGIGGSKSKQTSIATGGHRSTLVADGQSHSETSGLGGISPLAHPLGNPILGGRPSLLSGPALSDQRSHVAGGNDITGIANGLSTAQGGIGGARATQGSSAFGGNRATLVADGRSHASTIRKRSTFAEEASEREERRFSLFPNLRGNTGPAIATQNSQAHTGAGGIASASGLADANGGQGGAIANQQSGASAGVNGQAAARGQAIANASSRGPISRFRRDAEDDLDDGIFSNVLSVVVKKGPNLASSSSSVSTSSV